MRHNYYECNLCHSTDENQALRMFTYDIGRVDKYIICSANSYNDDDIIHICINCINRIKAFKIE
jgi:hypothetical protein